MLSGPALVSLCCVAFAELASLMCPAPPLVQLGTTELGRGLVAAADTPARTTLLTVDAFSTLCVADHPLRTGTAFSAAQLDDWQAVYGPLPPQLSSYLLSCELLCCLPPCV
jgi:hypothetical protein